MQQLLWKRQHQNKDGTYRNTETKKKTSKQKIKLYLQSAS